MPSLRRAWGRPGTRAIPVGWDAQHGHFSTSITSATVTLYPPLSQWPTPSLNPDTFEPLPATPPAPLWTGRGKVTAHNAARRREILGEQAVTIGTYDVELPRDTPPAAVGTVVEVTADDDEFVFGAQTLYVADVTGGDARFGRHLTCVDDRTAIHIQEG